MDQDPLIGRVIAQYRVLERLGEGGMGVVYLAEDTRLKRKVALKFIKAGAGAAAAESARFLREAQAAAALSHPHITTVHDVGLAQGRLFIAMEFLEGKTVREEVAAGPLPLEKALDYALQAADGLRAAHEKGIVHRDIKSANLMVSPGGTLKITDFGLARQDEGGESTQTGAVVGTVAYMSPEQASGEVVDQRTDIGALGVVLFEMVTGRRPCPAGNDRVTLNAILSAQPPRAGSLRKGLPPELDRIIGRCLEKDPARRYQTAAALKADLGRLSQAVSGRTVTLDGARLRRAGPRLSFRRHRRAVLFPLAALFLLGLVVGIWRPARETVARRLGWSTSPSRTFVAVLPFEVRGGNEEDRALSDGLAVILTGRLALVQRSQGSPDVLSAFGASHVQNPSPAALRERLHVSRVLTGTTEFLPDEVKITLNLFDAERNRPIQSRVVTAAPGRLGSLADALSDAAVKLLDLSLRPETFQAWISREACRPDIFPLCVEAQGYLWKWGKVESLDRAIGLFERSIEADPQCALALAGLSAASAYKSFLTSDDSLRATSERAAQRALGLNRELAADLAEVHLNLAVLCRDKRENEMSLAEVEAAAKLDPGNAEIWRDMGFSLEELGRVDEAEQAYLKAIALRPDSWQGYKYLGRFLLLHGRYVEAETNLRRMTALVPDNWEGYDYLGAAYLYEGRYEDAAAILKKAVKLFPTGVAYSNLGTSYFFQKRYAAAAEMYEKAIGLGYNKEVSIWGNLGDVYRLIPGSEAKASRAYGTAIRLARAELEENPKDGYRRKSLARFYALAGDKENALREIEVARTLLPENPTLEETAMQVYELCGKRDLALESLRRFLELGGSAKLVEGLPDLAGLRADPRAAALLSGKK